MKNATHLLISAKRGIMNNTHQNRAGSITQRVMLYLDGELSNKEERELLSEIQGNPDLLERFSMEKSFREFIRSKISRRTVSPALVESIKMKIRTNAHITN